MKNTFSPWRILCAAIALFLAALACGIGPATPEPAPHPTADIGPIIPTAIWTASGACGETTIWARNTEPGRRVGLTPKLPANSMAVGANE
jgi:hypothetical protein